jgi:hypothetical protein
MNKKEQNPIDPMKNWIKEAGIDSAGDEFHLSVLKKIEDLPHTSLTYEPVISTFGWQLIFTFISGIFGGTLLFLPADQNDISLFDKMPTLSMDLYNFSLPQITFSPPFLLGIAAFFILGFIMIVGTLRNKHASI